MYLKRTLCVLLYMLLPNILLAMHEEGYYTGPLFANPGEILPKNTLNVEPYYFYIVNKATDPPTSSIQGTSRGAAISQTSSSISDVYQLQTILGVTDWLNIQILPTLVHNVSNGVKFTGIGDTTIMPAVQLWYQTENAYFPSMNITVEETIPTGRYTLLNPRANGTDSTGLGSYQTNVGLNFQYIGHPFFGHESVANLNLNYLFASTTSVAGLNTYGGTIETSGVINPGDFISLDFSFEFSVTKNWVLVFETLLSRRQATSFSGQIAQSPELLDIPIGNEVIKQYTLAPAIEYNFNDSLGIIAGYWFTFSGNNTSAFHAPVVALSYITSG